MEEKTPYVYSYDEVLLRNGFNIIEANNKVFPLSGYLKKLDDNQILIIEVKTGHWDVKHFSLDQLKSDRLEAIILDKKDHATIQERNLDVNKNSLIQLQELSKRMNLDIAFK